jgi:hypothetical protein
MELLQEKLHKMGRKFKYNSELHPATKKNSLASFVQISQNPGQSNARAKKCWASSSFITTAPAETETEPLRQHKSGHCKAAPKQEA